MNFQDILASTGGPTTASVAPAAPTSSALLQTSSHPVTTGNVENVYPNSSVSSATTFQTTAPNGFEQKHPPVSSEHQSDRV
eukprot:jgi/Phyca11/506019/fgenesh2_kg.PHYCAscaffold_17_\